MELVLELLYGVKIEDRSKGEKCLEMKTHKSGAVIQFNPVEANLYKKFSILFEKVDFLWKPPLGVKIGDRF